MLHRIDYIFNILTKIQLIVTVFLCLSLTIFTSNAEIDNQHFNSIEIFAYNFKRNKFLNASNVSNQKLFGPLYKNSFPQETIYTLNWLASKFEHVGISSIERLDADERAKPGNHFIGLAIDIDYIVKNGQKYSHYSAFKGNLEAKKIFTKLALELASTKTVYQILTTSNFAVELRKYPVLSAQEGKGSINKIRIGTTPDGKDSSQRHENHFHIDIKKRN